MSETKTAVIGTYGSVAEADTDLSAVVAAHGESHLGHLELAVLVDDGSGPKVQRHQRVGGLRAHVAGGVSEDLTRLGWSLPGDPVSLVVLCESDDAGVVQDAASRATSKRTQPVEKPSLEEGYFESTSSMTPLPQANTNFEDGSVGHLGV